MSARSTTNRKPSLLDLAHGQAFADALALVRPELLAMAPQDVRPFAGEVATLVGRVEAAREAAGGDDEGLARIETLLFAFARAQLAYLFESPRCPVANYDGLRANAERQFTEIEDLVDRHVRVGSLSRADVPPRRKGVPQRCERVIRLLELLREHDLQPHDARRSERLAYKLHDARPAAPGELSPKEIRDRASTLLLRAIDEQSLAREKTEESGVFVIDDLVGAGLAGEMRASLCA